MTAPGNFKAAAASVTLAAARFRAARIVSSIMLLVREKRLLKLLKQIFAFVIMSCIPVWGALGGDCGIG